MFKIIKWILLILIGLQVINYFIVKDTISDEVSDLLEEHSCAGYEVIGVDLPLGFLIDTKTISTVYLTNSAYQSRPDSVDLKVDVIDPDIPLLKGKGNLRWRVSGKQIYIHFKHCFVE